jgi:membrane associated rhomboid family serine protease
MILPISAELGLGKLPFVTGFIIMLCLVIHHYQVQNRDAIESSSRDYCASIYNPWAAEDSLHYLRVDEGVCQEELVFFHSLPDKSNIPALLSDDELSAEELEKVIAHVKAHYDAFSQKAPASLDARLSYDPASFNPITSLVSALSHADWGHVIGNLIFFIAFAPALELLVGSVLKYIGILILIELVCDFSYSLASLGSYPVPTLGLSGVVMGVIGLSASMMPKARIRTFIWVLIHVRIYHIPSWMLALWFTGWDAYYLFSQTDSGGVNFVAHVSGAIAGYLIGLFLLKERREDIREELDDEIEYMRSQRADRYSMPSTYKGGKHRIANAHRERQAKEQFNCFMDEVYLLVDIRRDSEAIALLLDKYDIYCGSIEIYEEIFWDMYKWRQGKALLCLGRLNISLLLEHRQNNRALAIAKVCVAVKDEFMLANPAELLFLAEHAKTQQQYRLAYQLVHSAEARYGETIDADQCQLMEADLLEHHLNRPEAAQALIDMLLKKNDPPVYGSNLALKQDA